MKPKVVVVGLDGAEFTLVQRWMDEGYLPNLARIRREGAHGHLRSTIPPITPAAWTGFLTGKNPGKTGVYDFYQVRREDYALYYPNARDNKAETIQEILSEAGVSVGLVNVPMTYPPVPVNGYVIPGLGAPDKERADFGYPLDFLGKVEKETGIRYRILAEPRARKTAEPELVQSARTLFEERRAFVGHLLKSYATDFFATVISETDVFAHYFWKHMDADHPEHTPEGERLYGNVILETYRSADALIGEWGDACPPDSYFFVVSDHGMGPFYYAPDYLDYLGYRGWMKLRVGKPTSAAMLPWLVGLYGLWRLGRGLYEAGKRMLPWGIRHTLNRIFPRVRRLVGTNFSILDLIDWDRTKVYICDPRNVGYLFINLEGREPRGIVPPSEYGPLIRAIKEDLLSMRVPGTEIRIVEGVFARDEVYSGPFLEEMPDLVILWNYDATQWAKEMGTREAPESLSRLIKPLSIIPMASRIQIPFSAFHTMRGIFFARGPGIRPGFMVDDAKIYDMAPTLLALLGVPIPEDVDGRVLTEIFDSQFATTLKPRYRAGKARKIEPGSAYTKEEEALIRKRLEDLGYID